MNDTIFKMYFDLKKLIEKSQKIENKGTKEKDLFHVWKDAEKSFENNYPDYINRYEFLVKNHKSFTDEQINFICYQIGVWYFEWKDRIIIDLKNGTHRLGYAKEQLKELICGGIDE